MLVLCDPLESSTAWGSPCTALQSILRDISFLASVFNPLLGRKLLGRLVNKEVLIYLTVWMFLPVWKLKLVWTVGAIFSSTWLYPRAKHYQRKRSSLFQEKLKESGGLYNLFFYTSLPIFPRNSKKITLKEAKTAKDVWPQRIPNRSQLKIVFLYYYGNFKQDQAPLRDFLWQKRIPFKISRNTQSWWHWSPPMRLWIIDSNKNIFSHLW